MKQMQESPTRSFQAALQRAGGFWNWWTRALRACLPQGWQRLLGSSERRVLLSPVDHQLQVLLDDGGQRQVVAFGEVEAGVPLSPASWQDLPRHWLLPATAVLRRRMQLPAAATARLHDVLRFEVDRQTPFSAEQVLFDARSLGSRPDGQLEVELIVVPSTTVETLSRPPWRGTLAGIDVADADGVPLGVNLLPPGQRQQRRNPMWLWNLVLLVAALLCLFAAGNQLLDNRREAVEQLRVQVERQAQQARHVSSQRQQLQDLVDGVAFIQTKRREHAPVLALWNELSERLPDDTWLEKMSIESGELQLIGLSDTASSLVTKLEGADGWKTPSLTSVLQAEQGVRRGRFTLSAALKPVAMQGKEGSDERTDSRP